MDLEGVETSAQDCRALFEWKPLVHMGEDDGSTEMQCHVHKPVDWTVHDPEAMGDDSESMLVHAPTFHPVEQCALPEEEANLGELVCLPRYQIIESTATDESAVRPMPTMTVYTEEEEPSVPFTLAQPDLGNRSGTYLLHSFITDLENDRIVPCPPQVSSASQYCPQSWP